MKKVLLFAVSVALLTACTERESIKQDNTIKFGVRTVATKALINPWGIAGDLVTFPQAESFGVYADAVDGANISTLIDNGKVVYSSSDNVWRATNPDDSSERYTWPSAGSVNFYGYYPYSDDAYIYTTPGGEKRIYMPNVNVGNVIGSQTDPMVAVANNLQAQTRPTVNMVFKHATSQIVIMVKDVTNLEALKGLITLKEVKVGGLSFRGTYADATNIGKGTWSNLGVSESLTVFAGSCTIPTDDEVYLKSNNLTSTKEESALFITIPRNLVDGEQVITVTYDIAEYTLGGNTYPAKSGVEKSVSLTNYNADAQFKPGVRYIYHLGFTMDKCSEEILFNPVVDGWEVEENIIEIDCSEE